MKESCKEIGQRKRELSSFTMTIKLKQNDGKDRRLQTPKDSKCIVIKLPS